MAFAEDYVDVAERIREFRDKHPDGSLRPLNVDKPFEIVTTLPHPRRCCTRCWDGVGDLPR